MAGSSLLLLIDDIATLLDDVAVLTKVAAGSPASNRTATGVMRSSTRSVTLVSANSAATREDSIIVPPPNAPQSTAVAGAK